VGSEEGCDSGHFGRGGDARVAAARAGGGCGSARSSIRGKVKGWRLIGRVRLSARGGGRAGLARRGRKRGGLWLGRKSVMG
jgi:hypothetical protein